jgi:hypothetical protein
MQASQQQLDTLVAELFPVLRGTRGATEFLFDPAALVGRGTIRDYYLEYLSWLDISPAILPPDRLFIHANRPCPANLEGREDLTRPGSGYRFSLYIDNGLYRSPSALQMALAHELTHLRLILTGQQFFPDDGRMTSAAGCLPLAEEIRTDVASILLGFGKLVLNGVFEYAQVLRRAGYVAQLGYISPTAFVYLYRSVNALVGVAPEDAAAGLNGAARRAVTGTGGSGTRARRRR